MNLANSVFGKLYNASQYTSDSINILLKFQKLSLIATMFLFVNNKIK